MLLGNPRHFIGYAVIGCLAVLLGAELFLRLLPVTPRPSSQAASGLGIAVVPKPYVSYRTEADAAVDGLRTNRFGLRGPDVSEQAPSGTFRIVVAGGSSIFGPGISEEETIPSRIAEILYERYPDRSIEVVNAGQPWYNSTQILAQYQTLVTRFSPDVLLVMGGYPGFFNSLVLQPNPGFPALWGEGPVGSGLLTIADTQLRAQDVLHLLKKTIHTSALGSWVYSRFESSQQEPIPQAQVVDADRVVDTFLRNTRYLAAATKNDGVALFVMVQNQPFPRPECRLTGQDIFSRNEALRGRVAGALNGMVADAEAGLEDMKQTTHLVFVPAPLVSNPIPETFCPSETAIHQINRDIAEVFSQALAPLIDSSAHALPR